MKEYVIKPEFFERESIKEFYGFKVNGKTRSMTIKSNDKNYKIYVRELFETLTNSSIPCYSGILNGFDFIDDYANGFDKGTEYFNTSYTAKPDTMYTNADYINNLHICCFHKAPQKNKGWIYWVNSHPLVVTSKIIEEYGFYAGIFSALEKLKEHHPVAFKNFENCPEPESAILENMINHACLSELFDYNSDYDKLIGDFERKIAVTAMFLSESEFVEKERSRIHELFLTPTTVQLLDESVFKPGKYFKYDEYKKYAYDWLMQGNDRMIKDVISGARRNYIALLGLSSMPADFDSSIIKHLKAGVAYVAYYKFLSKKLNTPDLPIKLKVQTKANTLEDIFPDGDPKIFVMNEAIKNLNVTKGLSERAITGFINGCKEANVLPQISDTDLLRVVFYEIGKAYKETNKPRYDKAPYIKFFKDTKKYFGIR